ncbi:rhodanese-like domain-containing protein [Rubritalea marina]|uniref:rhodanese-like domain-containing protein n=1 Tax=Rubritalea marina TaxID=361055 RepID=UPI0003A3AD52|nr:rhodanese-like domain-containing protein [Rubritalea marina]
MADLDPSTAMSALLAAYPGAKRALFAKYHIGGCSSCAYRDDETLAEVCVRNEIVVAEAVEHILKSHEVDAAMLVEAGEVQQWIEQGKDFVFLDVRTREEHEAVMIGGSEFMTQERQQELFGSAKENDPIILYDHNGSKVLDTCAWFQGHGLKGTRGIIGGIDRWSQEVDSSIPRYRLEMD